MRAKMDLLLLPRSITKAVTQVHTTGYALSKMCQALMLELLVVVHSAPRPDTRFSVWSVLTITGRKYTVSARTC